MSFFNKDVPEIDLWEPGNFGFPIEELDEFLKWSNDRHVSDVSFQTGEPAYVEIHGQLLQATAAPLDNVVMQQIVNRLYGGHTGDHVLSKADHNDIDCPYEIHLSRSKKLYFRCNASEVLADGMSGINITIRILPGEPPTFDDLGIEPELRKAWEEHRGLNIVAGVPGSGKTTLLAAGVRFMLENGVGRIQSYEAPPEYRYDNVVKRNALMSVSAVPFHFNTFADGLRSSLRRRPSVVIVGEARDRETVEATIYAAQLGITVMATTHTTGVAQAFRRLLSEFSREEMAEKGAALVESLNLLVTQVLLTNPKGGRTALRECLFFDKDLRLELLNSPIERWTLIVQERLEATGNTLAKKAEAAFANGDITELDYRRYTMRQDQQPMGQQPHAPVSKTEGDHS